MTQSIKQKTLTRRFAPLGIVFALLGLLLFGYFVRKAGVAEIYEGIQRLGWGFLLVIVISGVRTVVRATAWTLCVEVPYTIPFWTAWRAYLTGDALGNLMPMGMVVSEPTKVAFVRDRLPMGAAASAIAIENLFYSLSVALFIFTGAAWLLLSFRLPAVLHVASIATLIGVVCFLLIALFVLRQEWKLLSYLLERLASWNAKHAWLAKWQAASLGFENRIYGFYKRNHHRLVPILLLEACFHLAGVVEGYVTLLFISDIAPTLLTAFLLESVNRVINVVFKFMPLRVGVDEAGTGLLTSVLQLGVGVGVTLAITRKARVLFWTAVGVTFLVRRGLAARDALKQEDVAIETKVEQRESSIEIVEEAGVR